MMQKKHNIFLIISVVFLLFFISAPAVFAVGAGEQAINGLNEAANRGFGPIEESGLQTDLPSAIGKVIGVGLSLIGVIFLILMIYSGFLWMLARGNETEVTKAKDLIQAAIIGLIIVLAAYAITQYVGEQLMAK